MWGGRAPLVRGRDLDAQELAADENVVPVRELFFAANPQVRPVAADHVGQDELGPCVFDLAVGRAHVEVPREIQIAAFAPDLEPATARAHRHAERPALENLDDLEM